MSFDRSPAPKRVLVHDSSGHAFTIELSRELARGGHQVLYVYCSSFLSPRGAVERQADDPESFAVRDIGLGRPFERFSFGKYSFGRRLRQEFTYGGKVADEIHNFRPDVVMSANGPLFSQLRIQSACRSDGVPFVLWLQDFYSVPMKAEARRRLGRLGEIAGAVLEQAERLLARRSASLVTISEDFSPKLVDWGVESGDIQVIHNWAPIEDLPVRPRNNPWSEEHGLAGVPVFLYTGTLGLKHNPALLWALARRLQEQHPDGRVVVASEGTGMDWLQERLHSEPIEQLVLLPFQPFDRYADVLGAADVLVALLEPGAGAYAVPSKVLSYLCAGRPVLAAIPEANLASRIVAENRAGVVVSPDDEQQFVEEGMRLLGDEELRRDLAASGRRYAEANFPIGVIAGKFEPLISLPRKPAGKRILTPQVRTSLRIGFANALNAVPDAVFEPLRRAYPNLEPGTRADRMATLALRVLRYRGIPDHLSRFSPVDNPSVSFANRDSYIAERLYWLGEKSGWEPEVLRWWRHWCSQSSNILELGANIGFFTVQGARANPAASYTAVEPHPKAAAICRENLQINDVDSVTVIQAAAVPALESPTIDLYLPGGKDHYEDAPCSSFAGESELHLADAEPIDTYKRVEVEAVEFRKLMEGVDLLKIDVEGLEHVLLASVEDVIRENRPTMFLEMLDRAVQLRTFLAKLCADTPYSLFVLQQEGLLLVEPSEIPDLRLSRFGTQDVVVTCGPLPGEAG